MKIRMKGNSIRLRLSKTDLRKLEQNEIVKEQTNFGNNILLYQLIPSALHQHLDASLQSSKIEIYIPQSFSAVWNSNDIVSISENKNLQDGSQLHILVEKDFQCLDKTSEDQSDFFVNPNKSCQ